MSLGEVAMMERRLAVLGHVVVDYDRYNAMHNAERLLRKLVKAGTCGIEPMFTEDGGIVIDAFIHADDIEADLIRRLFVDGED